ncbi:uncharacterized protein LOC114174419 [Vigna unguiculata]|uniref:uncharacterized protein LOC114174419 n=1 Tax=Vigna unguiculata TaxID=3917 RepID=UPI0010164136|nr:uncharacterized protein LOC114174419 [Vigna unguiculata]
MIIGNDMRTARKIMDDGHIVEKILRTLSDKYNYIVCSIEESKDINTMIVDELHCSLLVHEHKIQRKKVVEQALKVIDDNSAPQAYEQSSRGRGHGGYRGRGRGRGRGQGRAFYKSIVECYRCHKLGHF